MEVAEQILALCALEPSRMNLHYGTCGILNIRIEKMNLDYHGSER